MSKQLRDKTTYFFGPCYDRIVFDIIVCCILLVIFLIDGVNSLGKFITFLCIFVIMVGWLFSGLLIYYKEVTLLEDYMTVQNVLSATVRRINYQEITSLSEIDIDIGRKYINTHYLIIETKEDPCSIYMLAIEKPQLLKQILEEKIELFKGGRKKVGTLDKNIRISRRCGVILDHNK